MKYLLILIAALLAGCHDHKPIVQTQIPQQVEEDGVQSEEGCTVQTSSKLKTEHQVSPITNLVKRKEELGASGRCIVEFDIEVDGKSYHLEEEEQGLEQLESLCYYARERARKNLLLDLGGEFESRSAVECLHKEL